jgi:hypothetical protein
MNAQSLRHGPHGLEHRGIESAEHIDDGVRAAGPGVDR